jgi:hypothetical protein
VQEKTASAHLLTEAPAIAQTVLVEKNYLLGGYQAIQADKAAALVEPVAQAKLAAAQLTGQFDALAHMAIFPALLLAGYIGLFLFFRAKGGYRPVQLDSASTHS